MMDKLKINWVVAVELKGILVKKKCRVCKTPMMEVNEPEMFDEDGQPHALSFCLICKGFVH
jgi:hypothetical protein